jgi:hypothetical protein
VTAEAEAARSRYWCRRCDEPAKVTADPALFLTGPLLLAAGTAAHAGTGSELCADGQVIAPTDEDPVLRRQARELEAEFPGFSVSVRFRFFRADWREALRAEHFEAQDAAGLRRQLAAATRRPPC